MLFVRHAPPVVDRSVPAADWSLAPGAELSLAVQLPLVSSAETKARQTAALLGEHCEIDARLGEVTRGWSDNFEAEVARYLDGEALEGWEPQRDACARFTAAVDEHGDATYVTHGTVLTLYLSSVVPDLDPFTFWRALTLPDAWAWDGATRRLERVARGDARATT